MGEIKKVCTSARSFRPPALRAVDAKQSQVKVVGALALLDEREMDWKVLVVDVNHPAANLIQGTRTRESCSKFSMFRRCFRSVSKDTQTVVTVSDCERVTCTMP